MKIEMGESLFYSWLRHVKECQIVQTNWKVSPQWNLEHEEDIEYLMRKTDDWFSDKYDYSVFKQNASLSQILQQGECDVVGISIQNNEINTYAIDVAFHEGGLNYGSREVTVMKVIAKTVRTAMCLWGYMGCKNAEIIFASPKINPAVLNDIEPCIAEVNEIFEDCGLEFKARVIANEEFNDVVLQPILMVSDGVADTSELFLRSYQMFSMFSNKEVARISPRRVTDKIVRENNIEHDDNYKEFKVGKIARVVLRKILEDGSITDEELYNLQQAYYSKRVFDIQYPLLVKKGDNFDTVRYYSQPVIIKGEVYYMCSQWFETVSNNDRPYLIKWIEEHK